MADDLRMLTRLTTETQRLHGDADGDVDAYLFKAQVTAEDYRTYLGRHYGFLAPLEIALATAPGLDEVIDVKARAKSALIVHDLLALGMTVEDVNALPRFAQVPSFRGPAAALGWMFAIERPLLSAAVIRGQLARFLPSEMAVAAAYLGCYQGQVGAMWRALGEAMDRVAYLPAIGDRMVVAAQEAFRGLARWRRDDRGRSAVIRIAG